MSAPSLMAASFATAIGVLIATQGVLYSVGFTIMYFPVISMLNEWFVPKRSLALSMLASTGVGAIAMPFVLATLLNTYGSAPTLRTFAVYLVILTDPVLPMLRCRRCVCQSS